MGIENKRIDDSRGIEAPPAGRETVWQWLVGWFSEWLGVDGENIDPRASFHHLGMTSVESTRLLADFEQQLGRKLEPTVMWEYPTIDRLAGFLAGDQSHSAKDPAAQTRATFGRRGLASGVPEPIAVVGMSVRAPGANSVEEFWNLLENGLDPITEHPPDRWRVDGFHDPDPNATGKTVSRFGGFLTGVDSFDATFFKITPREAIQMDPQQRLLLEMCWEALEDGSSLPSRLMDQQVGVYVGAMFDDYATLGLRNLHRIVQHSAIGQNPSALAGRLSYYLGLQGPSMTVNTACSSSLVALHLACTAIWTGEADAALAGGINLILAPHSCVAMSKFGGLSPAGRCRSFDADASGYVRSEGGGLVFLKPLSSALADGDHVYCTIVSSAVNSDGASNGLTAPNEHAQEKLLQRAYGRAEIPRSMVDYVEAHGTGTKLGDPIEAKAIASVLAGRHRSASDPLIVGSVKSNIGHAESAAGVLAFAKVALAIQKRAIPPNLHFDEPNPHIPFGEWCLRVPVELEEWPRRGHHRPTAGISSFGFSGTNCHLVAQGFDVEPWHLMLLSEETSEKLRARALEIVSELPRAASREFLENISYTESMMAESAMEGEATPERPRVGIYFSNREELVSRLSAFAEGKDVPTVHSSLTKPKLDRRLSFLLSGQGTYWPGGGRLLAYTEPTYMRTFERCDALIREQGGASPLEHLVVDSVESWETRIDDLWPYLFTHQVALAELWKSWGVVPDFIIGHSIGEVAAAHVTGALSLEDCVTVIMALGRFAQLASGASSMLAVGLSWEDSASWLEDERSNEARVWRAIDLSPSSCILSGDHHAVERLARELEEEGIFCRQVQTTVPSHTPLLRRDAEALQASLARIKPRAPGIPWISTVTGKPITGSEVGPEYWARNFWQPVLFRSAVEHLLDRGARIFLELNTHSVLTHPVSNTLEHHGLEGAVLGSMRRGEPGVTTLRESYAELYARGVVGGCQKIHAVSARKVSAKNVPAERVGEDHREERSATPRRSHPLMLSGRSKEALRARVEHVKAKLDSEENFTLEDLCYTASVKRDHLEHRFACVASSRQELRGALASFLDGRSGPWTTSDVRAMKKNPTLGFVFSGQGTQWLGMARELREIEPRFAARLGDLHALLEESSDGMFSLLDELDREEDSSRLGEAEVAQPCLYAIQVALAELWMAYGLEPSAVVGHSLGEIAALQIAGALAPRDAARLVLRRGRIMQQTTGRGRMVATRLSAERAGSWLEGRDGVSLAAVNGEKSICFAGDVPAIEALMRDLESDGQKVRDLGVNYAFHSHQMEEASRALAKQLANLTMSTPHIRTFSTVSGAQLEAEDLGADYWRRNMRQPVLFHKAIGQMVESGVDVFIEISPHPALAADIDATARSRDRRITVLPSLRRARSDSQVLCSTLTELFARGIDIEWKRVFSQAARTMALPPYPFQKQRYWLDHEGFEATADVTVSRPADSGELESAGVDASTSRKEVSPMSTESTSMGKNVESDANNSHEDEFLQILAQVGHLPPGSFEDHLRLQEDLGFDSLMLVQVRESVDSQLGGVDLPQRMLYADKPIGELKELVLGSASAAGPAAGGQAGKSVPTASSWNLESLKARASELMRAERGLELLDKRFVHKHDEDNALLGVVEHLNENEYLCEMRRKLDHAFFYEHPQDHIPGLYLIEGVRQFCMAVTHLFYEVPFGEQFVWDDFSVEFHKMVEHEVPVFIALRVEEFENRTVYQRFAVIQDGATMLTGSNLMRIFNKAHYTGKRSEARASVQAG